MSDSPAVPPSPAHPEQLAVQLRGWAVAASTGASMRYAVLGMREAAAALDALSPAPPAEPDFLYEAALERLRRERPTLADLAPPASPAPPSPEPPKVRDLMAALEESVRAAKAARQAHRAAPEDPS